MKNERKELQRQYMEAPKYAGIFLITNAANDRSLMGSSANLHGPLNRHRFMLSIGTHTNVEMQRDYNVDKGKSFRFEIIAQVEQKLLDPAFNLEDELSLLEQIWIEKLEPFSGRGYNRGTHIRE